MSGSSPIGPLDYAQKRYQRSIDRGMGLRGGSNPVPYPDPQLQTNFVTTTNRADEFKLTTPSFVTSPNTAENQHVTEQHIQHAQQFKAYSPNTLSPDALSPNASYSPRRPSIPKVESPEVSSTPDQIAQLRQKIKSLRSERDAANVERDEAMADKENMLTELLTTEAKLQEIQEEMSRHKDELSSLRGSHARQRSRGDGHTSNNGHYEQLQEQPYQSDSQLRSELQRLQHRCAKAEAYAHQMQSQKTTLTAQVEQDLRAADSKASQALSLADFHQSQAESYLRQLMDLRDSRSASAAAAEQESQKSKIDTEALEKLKTTHTAEIEDVKKVSDFYKSNSESAAKKNKEMVLENRRLQDLLHARDREVGEQKSLIEALKLQMGDMPGGFPGRR